MTNLTFWKIWIVSLILVVVSAISIFDPVDAKPVPREAELYYQQHEQACRASVILLHNIDDTANRRGLWTFDLFKVDMEEHGNLPPNIVDTVKIYAKLYYDNAQFPWSVEVDQTRIPLADLQQYVYTECTTKLRIDLEEYMNKLERGTAI